MLLTNVVGEFHEMRLRLEQAFAPDTSVSGHHDATGHCAAVALIVQNYFGGDLVSCSMQDQSHWFNRMGKEFVVDVDLTGDQFGFPPVMIAPRGGLYGEGIIRTEVNQETWDRAKLLASRIGYVWTPRSR